jgi:hypothetical protein
MESTLSPDKTASAIWGRIVKPDRGTLTPEAARAILKMDSNQRSKPLEHIFAAIWAVPRSGRYP